MEYRDPRDADDAMYRMDGSNIGGRDITVKLQQLTLLCSASCFVVIPAFSCRGGSDYSTP